MDNPVYFEILLTSTAMQTFHPGSCRGGHYRLRESSSSGLPDKSTEKIQLNSLQVMFFSKIRKNFGAY
jgi:hypothetical protein